MAMGHDAARSVLVGSQAHREGNPEGLTPTTYTVPGLLKEERNCLFRRRGDGNELFFLSTSVARSAAWDRGRGRDRLPPLLLTRSWAGPRSR